MGVDAGLSLDELLRAHPWPRAHAGERRLEWLWTIDVDLAPAALWPLVADVSRLNRALGNPVMTFEERGGERFGRGRYGGVLHTWREVPWDWVAGRWFAFVREYQRGAMKTLYAVHRLEPLSGDRTRLYVYFGVVPRWWALAPIMKLSFAAIGRAYRRTLPALTSQTLALPAAPPPPALRPGAELRLDTIAATLRERGLDPTAIERLIEHVRTGDELDLVRIQVRERARAWGLDEDQLLRVCLHATRAGLLELTWDVVCPHCRGVRESEARLAEVPTEGACEVCAITFGTEDAVEVSFRVQPAVREVEPRLFCSAEPATKQHIRVQRALPPGEEATVDVDLPPGRYRLRRRGQQAIAGWLDVSGREQAALAWRASDPPGEQAAAAHTALTLVNDEPAPTTFVVETAQPSDLALRPGRLLSHQEFRDLFADEYLGADVRLAVGEQTILFTDLVGSTAMYARRGDPAAFVAVRQHFTEVFALVARHRGAIVKTIGDAAMAAFTDPVDAVRAAEAIQRAFAADGGLRLRVSINTGACIAVRLNANIDYFGHAVNLAAKLQAIAGAGQIALAAATVAAPGVRAYLDQAGAALEPCEVTVKGLPAPVRAHRWTVP